LKVALVIYGSLSTLSGGYLYDRKLVEYLQLQGDEVELISLPWRNYLNHCSDNWNRELYKQLQTLKVDILLQDELNHPSLFLLNKRLRKLVPYPIVSIVHHLRCNEQHAAPLLGLYRKIEGLYINSVDGFIFNSYTTMQTVQKLLKHPKPYLVASPGGDSVPLEAIAPGSSDRPKGPVQLLFVGNWIPRKNLHLLIRALENLKTYPWHLSLVGRTDVDVGYERKIRGLINTSKIGENIDIYGAVSDTELYRLWQNADVLVVPSQYEGFGIVYLEAMRFGVIPIGGKNGAAGEIIQSGVNGFLVETQSHEELRQVLIRILTDSEERNKLKTACRLRYTQFPGWQESMASIRQFLLDIFIR
jgi:glycosyltransferase involved in cell wall biosynthesis